MFYTSQIDQMTTFSKPHNGEKKTKMSSLIEDSHIKLYTNRISDKNSVNMSGYYFFFFRSSN